MTSTGVGNRRRSISSFKEIDHRLALRRDLLAQVKERLIALKPGRVIVEARHATPDLAFGLSECIGCLHARFDELRLPFGGKGPLPVYGHLFFEERGTERFSVPDAWSGQDCQVKALAVVLEIDCLKQTLALRFSACFQLELLIAFRPGHHQFAVLSSNQPEEDILCRDINRGLRIIVGRTEHEVIAPETWHDAILDRACDLEPSQIFGGLISMIPVLSKAKMPEASGDPGTKNRACRVTLSSAFHKTSIPPMLADALFGRNGASSTSFSPAPFPALLSTPGRVP